MGNPEILVGGQKTLIIQVIVSKFRNLNVSKH